MALSPDDREELSRAARQFLDRASSPGHVRAVVDNPDDADQGAGTWKQIVDMGWTGIHVPQEHGGAGAGYEGLGIIVHEMGRHLTTAPYLASTLLATEALLQAADSDVAARYLPRLAAGESRGAVAFQGQPLVLDAEGADFLVVETATGVWVLDEFDTTHVPTVDRTRRLYEVDSDPSSGTLLAEGEPADSLVEHVGAVGAIAAAADAAGAAERITELTVDYAKNRFQFGKPIGSFQAVKHHCADMTIAVEASRAAVRAGFEALDDPDGDVLLAADVVSSYCGPACSQVCGLAIQVHGGIGFTWEHDAHLFLKRAKLDESMFGTPVSHRRRLAAKVFPRISAQWANQLPFA